MPKPEPTPFGQTAIVHAILCVRDVVTTELADSWASAVDEAAGSTVVRPAGPMTVGTEITACLTVPDGDRAQRVAGH